MVSETISINLLLYRALFPMAIDLRRTALRFNITLRKEILNAEWFSTTKQAQAAINVGLKQCNHVRPPQALNKRPPVPESLAENGL